MEMEINTKNSTFNSRKCHKEGTTHFSIGTRTHDLSNTVTSHKVLAYNHDGICIWVLGSNIFVTFLLFLELQMVI